MGSGVSINWHRKAPSLRRILSKADLRLKQPELAWLLTTSPLFVGVNKVIRRFLDVAKTGPPQPVNFPGDLPSIQICTAR
jgi:hypothetical protein